MCIIFYSSIVILSEYGWMINIKRYTMINTSLFIIGLFTNITLVLSLLGVYVGVKTLLNNRMKLHHFKLVVLLMLLFILSDCIDLIRYIIEWNNNYRWTKLIKPTVNGGLFYVYRKVNYYLFDGVLFHVERFKLGCK